MYGRYVTDILKMCMKKFNAEKIIFNKFTRFLSAHCGGYTVSHACSQFLLKRLSLKPKLQKLTLP